MRIAFDAGSIDYEGKWEGVGPWKLRLFWALLNGIEPVGECHLGPEKLEISMAQPPPPPLALVMDAARIKSITHKAMSCIGSFMYKSPRVVLGPYHPSSAVR